MTLWTFLILECYLDAHQNTRMSGNYHRIYGSTEGLRADAQIGWYALFARLIPY